MNSLFRIASTIASPWALAAYGVAAVVFIVTKLRRGKVSTIALVCILLLVLGPILAAGCLEMVHMRSVGTSIYRVRVTVLGTQTPVENAVVWSTMGGEPLKVSGGWEFDIPASKKPADAKLTIFAEVPPAFLSGRRDLLLANDYNPAITIQLQRDTSALVRGIVINNAGKAVEGAHVSIVGYDGEGTITSREGHFVLPAHAADGQQVLLHVEKVGLAPVNQYHPAGTEPATVVLQRR